MGKGADLGAGRMEPGSHIGRSPKRVTVVSRLLVTHGEGRTLVSGERAE